MITALAAGAALLVGAALDYSLNLRTISRLCQKLRSIRAGNGGGKMKTSKKVVWICLAMGFSWVWCSYILAYLDKMQIAESLSQVAVTEIIGVVLAYCIKSAVENLSKNNHWSDIRQLPTPTALTGQSRSGKNRRSLTCRNEPTMLKGTTDE